MRHGLKSALSTMLNRPDDFRNTKKKKKKWKWEKGKEMEQWNLMIVDRIYDLYKPQNIGSGGLGANSYCER